MINDSTKLSEQRQPFPWHATLQRMATVLWKEKKLCLPCCFKAPVWQLTKTVHVQNQVKILIGFTGWIFIVYFLFFSSVYNQNDIAIWRGNFKDFKIIPCCLGHSSFHLQHQHCNLDPNRFFLERNCRPLQATIISAIRSHVVLSCGHQLKQPFNLGI